MRSEVKVLVLLYKDKVESEEPGGPLETCYVKKRGIDLVWCIVGGSGLRLIVQSLLHLGHDECFIGL